MRLFELKTDQTIIDAVKTLWDKYRSAKLVARETGLTPAQVHKILERYHKDRDKTPGRTTPEWLIARIKELWDNGYQAKEIVRIINIPTVDYSKVRKVLDRYFPDRPKRAAPVVK